MIKENFTKSIIVLSVCWIAAGCGRLMERAPYPHLRQQGTTQQLIVDGKPFLMLGGELGNSSASSLRYMDAIRPTLSQMHLNTVLAPVYWDLIEPQEGAFDFSLVDGLIKDARRHDMRLVLLWFGMWKNSMSCYAPEWVKVDEVRFPRARTKAGEALEIVSAFSENARQADTKAFAAMMEHLKKIDGRDHTVIMVQVENEIGMLTDARDWNEAANEAFAEPVPRALMHYLAAHKDSLVPELGRRWADNGTKTTGTWEEVFGRGLATDEIFMAWHYARYVQAVAAAGKAAYPLPMYVNAALIRPGYKPGQYPSAGPLPHLIDVWRAGAPVIDFLSPDIYFQNFAEWAARFNLPGNPLFIPETRLGPDAAAHAFYAVGALDAMGFSPFSIESTDNPSSAPITRCYRALEELSPLILAHQGSDKIAGVLLDKDHQKEAVALGGYVLTVSHDYTWGWSGGDREADTWPRAGGVIIATGPGEYVIGGDGIIVTFAPAPPEEGKAGIVSIREKVYSDEADAWVKQRWMNGDQSHQGRHLRLPFGTYGIQTVKLYQYQ